MTPPDAGDKTVDTSRERVAELADLCEKWLDVAPDAPSSVGLISNLRHVVSALQAKLEEAERLLNDPVVRGVIAGRRRRRAYAALTPEEKRVRADKMKARYQKQATTKETP